MWMRYRGAFAPALLLFMVAFASGALAQIDAETFGGYEARAIGTAATSGRVADMDVVQEGQRLTIYVGSASGGVWRSKDSGITFQPVFDKQPVLSIGAVKIDPSNPKTVWAGTGESWTRNSVSIGGGVFRSKDGGDNWEAMGLSDSERIARILVDPKNSSTVYVCATGRLWGPNQERGVFKTTDAGKTWTKALYVDENTGCADLDLDPANPQVLYAAMWQFRRKPYAFESGGPKSALMKSADGGASWKQLKTGLPTGTLGRIGLAVAPSKPNVVYAVVEAKRTALFRSDDSGESWREMNNSFNITGRPFYFARIVVDPKNADRVYKPGFGFTVSDDGGKTFSRTGVGGGDGGAHGDYHAVWVNPANTDNLFVGTDGGVYESTDRGAHMRFVASLPISQFYHVSFDMERPYNVYGGLQDNGTWMGPSSAPGGIYNRHWRNLGFGDGFWAFVDPKDPDIVYFEYQGGHVYRARKSTGESKDIQPLPRGSEPELRFNWNTPIHIGAASGSLYAGGQFLFRSTDRGDSWDRISPDLTTGNPEWLKQEESGGVTIDNSDAEKYETIFTIAESPKNANLIWAGTDDGNVQITRDGGKTWTNVVKNIPGLPANTWVSTIYASTFDEGTAFATFDGHMGGDMKPYVYKTADFGQTWQPLAGEGIKGFAHVIRQDLVNPDLLFAGTELGLFLSLDGGQHWAQFTGNIPSVPVRDIVIHPREGDLIVATHGRGIYIVDDLTPIRHLTPAVAGSDAAFLPTRSPQMVIPVLEQRFDGDAEYQGRPLSEAATIVYFQKKRHIFGDLRFEIYGPDGKRVATEAGSKRRGLNRLEWSTRMKPPRVPPAASLVQHPFALYGPRAPQGTYTVKMIKGKSTYSTQFTLVPDARAKHSDADRQLQHETVMKLYAMLERLTFVTDSVVDARNQARERASKLPAKDALARRLGAFAASMDELRSRLVAVKEGGAITGEEKLREKIGSLYGSVNGYDGRPSQSQIDNIEVLGKKLDQVALDFQAAADKQLAAINAALVKKKLDPIKTMAREDWEKKS